MKYIKAIKYGYYVLLEYNKINHNNSEKNNILQHKRLKYRKYHWQYWVSFENGKAVPKLIPEKYMKMMYAIWKADCMYNNINIREWYCELHATYADA